MLGEIGERSVPCSGGSTNGEVSVSPCTGETGDMASFRNGSFSDRVETGVWAVVEARDVARDMLVAAAAVAPPAAIVERPPADGYGGGAVATESGRGKGSDVDDARPVAIGTVEGGCACDTASRYGGATSSSTLWILGLAA